MAMDADFGAIARWIAQQDSSGRSSFHPPASDAQIDAAERALGVTLPGEVRDLYRLANGQPESGVALEGAFLLLPLDGVVDAAAFLNGEFPDGVNLDISDDAVIDADPGVRAGWWSRGWIPLLENGGGDHLCVDLDPVQGGTNGQIISYYHDEFYRARVADGVAEMLARLAAKLASGRCRIEHGMIEDFEG